jgi:hypothetical protein
MGPCLCGDYMCPSCGPAQGYDPKFEALCETLGDRVGTFFEGIGLSAKEQDSIFEMILEKVADIFAKQAQDADIMDRCRQMDEDEKAYQDYMTDNFG